MSQTQRIAITGATGFLGSHLTERLLQEGYQVNVHARDAEKAKRFADKAAYTVIADICDQDAINALCQGCDVVIHTVSNFRTASGPAESYRRINVEGTATVLRAAKAAGVKRFIYCSTIGVHGHVKDTPASETSPYNPGDLYQETKLEAQQLCEQAMREQEGTMEVVIVRPCSMYGPGDLRMLKMFRMLAKRRFFTIGPCDSNFHAVYIDDIVEGFLKVINSPTAAGQTYIIGGDSYIPLKQYIATAAEAVGAPPPWLKFPYWLFYGAAVACEALFVPLRIEPPLHRRRIRFFTNNRAFTIDKAKRELNYQPQVDFAEGMRRTVAWYRENHYL